MQTENSPLKLALTNGIYYALIVISVQLIIWATAIIEKTGLFSSFFIMFFNLGILIFFLLFCTKKYRDNLLNGTITFGQAFIYGLMIVVFSSIITGLFQYILNRYIDPDYAQRMINAIQEKTYQFMLNNGVPEDQIDQAMVKFDTQTVQTPLQALTDSLKSGVLLGSIISLITSLIVKKNTSDSGYEKAMSELDSQE
ncbi:DUF4199 domain-containing protein [Mangrovibacterium marinum]|uniref:Uncharacterized protein DUF4199 n=1 Tax=Mangrovibacterium marinum TaxID=1639118 RepID=A0A2T5C4G8_9BACT|nr:DUF4199 domain-containing protein [Mangrovibacterium marinum]PTN09760.1 uncharacterized protein DUF4199 [Mangrovibacterium marinum]